LLTAAFGNNHGKVRKELFSTEDQAIERARSLLASGEAFACVLEDDNGTERRKTIYQAWRANPAA
jgi:hypothetical protein